MLKPRVDFSNIDPLDLAWAAGLLEGEGNFQGRIQKSGSPLLAVRCNMTDYAPIAKLQYLFGGTFRGPVPRGINKPMYEWWLGRTHGCIDLVKMLRSWMSPRRQEAIDEMILQDELHPARKLILPGQSYHGTTSGYFNHNCRCDECKLAGSESGKAGRRRKKEKELLAI